MATSTRVYSLVQSIERELSWLAHFGSIIYKYIEVCFVGSGSFLPMMGLKYALFSFIEIDLDYYVGCGTNTRHIVKGVGYVGFQLKSRESLKIIETLSILEVKVNLLSVSTLKEEGYGVASQHGNVLIYLVEASHDTTLMLGVRYEKLYKLLG